MAILIQLGTGISRLNGYLHIIQATASPYCECVQEESVQHFLFNCSRWIDCRRVMRAEHGKYWDDISHAIGGRRRGDGSGDSERKNNEWQPNKKAVLATIAFAKGTERLGFGGR